MLGTVELLKILSRGRPASIQGRIFRSEASTGRYRRRHYSIWLYENGLKTLFINPYDEPTAEPYGTGWSKGFRFVEYSQIIKIHPKLITFTGFFGGTYFGLRFILPDGNSLIRKKDRFLIADIIDFNMPDFTGMIMILESIYGSNWKNIFAFDKPILTKNHTVEEFQEKWLKLFKE